MATVIWIGGLFVTVIQILPAVQRILDGKPEMVQILSIIRKRFFPISNLSLAVLIVTGLFQMTADPNYEGFLQMDNQWSIVIFLKHIAIIGMAISGLFLQYVVAPSLERASLLVERNKSNMEEWHKFQRQERLLTWLNVALGILILGFSAWATSL